MNTDQQGKKEYNPKVYKFIISPYYANYTLSSKLPHDDNDDWKVIANGGSGKETIKRVVLMEVEKIFEEYDYDRHE